MSVRVRFAPSPTGSLHVGGARTALFNYLFAKKHKGSFVLRIEDTDQERHQEDSILPLLENLKWLGLEWEEGPLPDKISSYKGDYAPYRQRERLSIYKKQALSLIEQGKAYYCFMSLEEEARQKEKAISQGKTWRVSSPYRDLPLKSAEEKIKKGEKFCIRFKSSPQSYTIKDLIRGEIQFPSDSLGDFILIRTDDFPVYNFSCAIDDGMMKISHVFRGEEHLSNTLKQRLIQKALALPCPQTAHLSIILGKDKKKLSKRWGSENVDHYKKEGFLPSAMINFLSLLGWNPGTEQEFFSKEELISHFDIKRLNLSSAVFDKDKLLWLNEEHIKSLSDKELLKEVKAFLKNPKTEDSLLEKLIPALRSNFKTLKQSAQMLEMFLEDGFSINKASVEPVFQWPKSRSLVEKWIGFLKNLQKTNINMDDFSVFQKQIQSEDQIKGKNFFMPLRCALMGQPEGAEIKILIGLLEKNQLIKRAETLLKEI